MREHYNKVINFCLTPSNLARLEEEAAKRELTRSDLIRELVYREIYPDGAPVYRRSYERKPITERRATPA